MQVDHKCVYAPCECMIKQDQEYCSDSCRYNDNRTGARVTEEECDCGHHACTEEMSSHTNGVAI